MPTKNPWLNPYQRSFNSIKDQLKASLQERVPEITDYSEGNIFMIILSIYAAIAEVLHYYIDNMARETFFSSARRYSSLFKHAKLVDYHVKSAIPASVDLTLYTKNGNPLASSINIPVGTVFTSADGKPWSVMASQGIFWDKNLYPKSIRIPVIQTEIIGQSSRISFGQILSYDNLAIAIQGIPDGKYYVEGSMVLYVDDEVWELVDTFAYSNPSSKHYKVELDGNLVPTIIFGDGRFGRLPKLYGQVTGYFQVTYGQDGNISEGSFTTVPSIPGADTSNIGVTNYNSAAGGSNYENFAMLKEHVPLSIKTLGVAITKEDFEAAARLVGGVNKAYAEYVCGKEVRLYITPDNGEIEASQALLDSVAAKLNTLKVITTTISVLSVHKAIIYLDASVYGKKSFQTLDIKNQVVGALQSFYGFENAELGRPVRLSDIYSLLDNLSTVEYLNINKVYVLPTPILLSSAGVGTISPELKITTFNQISYTSPNDFQDIYVEIVSNGYKLTIGSNVYSGTFGSSKHIVDTYIEFDITIGSDSYNVGDRYWFYLGRMNTNLSVREETSYRAIPVFVNKSDALILDIHESV